MYLVDSNGLVKCWRSSGRNFKAFQNVIERSITLCRKKKKLKRQKIKTTEKDAHCTALLSLSNIKCARTGTRLASIVTSHTHTGFYTAHPNPSQTIHSITSSHFLLKTKNSKKQNYVLEIKKTKNNCEFRRGDDARE